MNISNLLRHQDAEFGGGASVAEAEKPVSPTLLIGIGGTGANVLLRLRRLIVERYGSLDALPFLQFVHMDTDCTATAKEQYNLKSGDDPLHSEVRFVPAERIDLTIEGGKYIEYINAYAHIKRWFPTGGKIAHLGNLGEGAGQIRVASRLGFFYAPNFTKITSRLEQCKTLLKDASIMKKVAGLGFEFDPSSINVFVVSSLAGGTGSGTFLDMSFLLQRYFPSAERVGILLLPSLFKDYAGGERVRANGFAALMELNHYSFGHSFHADWDRHRAQILPPPPYSTTYLIDGMNEAGLVLGSPGEEFDAYQMVAETLFQDYSIGKFAGMKRATRINLVNFNLNVYTHNFLNEALRPRPQDANKTIVGDTYPTRFGSFGLASILFPTDRLHSAAACRLAAHILEFWEKSLLDDPLQSLFTNFLAHEDVRFAQGRYERKDGGGVLERQDVEDALLVYDSGSSRTFQSYLWQKAQTIRTEIENAPRGQKAAILAEQRSLLEQFLAKEDSDNPDEWGVGVRQIDANMRACLERTKRGIEKRAAELANDPRLGVAYTLSLLQQLKQILRTEPFPYLLHFEAGIATWRDEIQTWAFELDQVQMEIGRHERQLLFRGADLERDLEKLVADEKSEEPGVLYNYLYSRVMKQVAKRGKLICEEIEQFLGKDDPTGKGLIAQYYGLLAGFGKLKERLLAKERYFAKAEKYELTISLYREEDLQIWFRRWGGESVQEPGILRTVGNQLLKNIFLVDSATADLAHIQRTPIDTIEENVLAHCDKYLAAYQEQLEALSILLESNRFSVSVSEREEMIRRAYNLAKVWMRRPEQGLEHTGLNPVSADQRHCLIGLDTGNVPRLEEFKRLIQEIKRPGGSQPAFFNLGMSSNCMIVFYSDLAGVLAFCSRPVISPNLLRQAYFTYRGNAELHIVKNRIPFGYLISTLESRNMSETRQPKHLSYRRSEGFGRGSGARCSKPATAAGSSVLSRRLRCAAKRRSSLAKVHFGDVDLRNSRVNGDLDVTARANGVVIATAGRDLDLAVGAVVIESSQVGAITSKTRINGALLVTAGRDAAVRFGGVEVRQRDSAGGGARRHPLVLKELHTVKLYILFPLAIFALPLAAQDSSTIRPASTTEGVFERLQVKNRSRLFLDTPGPGGENYVYLDDFNLNSGEGLSPEIRVRPGTRGVTTVVHTFTPSRLCSLGSDTSIGTVRLRDAQFTPGGIQLRTILDLKQPLETEVRERGRPEGPGRSSVDSVGSRGREHDPGCFQRDWPKDTGYRVANSGPFPRPNVAAEASGVRG